MDMKQFMIVDYLFLRSYMSELSEKIRLIISQFPRNFMRVIKGKSNQKLLQEIYNQTDQLGNIATIKTRLYWLLNEIKMWSDKRVCCEVCGKELKDKNVISITKGYKKTCSKDCERKLAYKHAQETCLKKYGCENSFQIDTVKEKLAKEQKVIQNKRDKTRQQHFKDDKGWNLAKSIETRLKKYGNTWNLEGVKLTKFLKYGNSTYNNPEKNTQTKRKNGTFNTSSQEAIVYMMLCQKFGKDNVIWQFKSEKYPFMCDFYLKQFDLYIECNFSWTHGGCAFNENKNSCIEKLNKWKEKAKTSKFYQNAIETWTVRDIKKISTAKKNNLNYLVFWTINEANNWIKHYD